MGRELFAASEIASVLRCTPRAVRERFAGIAPADGGKCIRGQIANAWPVSAFPHSLLVELERIRNHGGIERFRSIAAMVAHYNAQPGDSLRKPADDSETARVEHKRTVLAPLLRKHVQSGTDLARIAEIARQHFPSADSVLPNARTVRRWLECALERDNARGDFDNPALYLDETQPRPRQSYKVKLVFPRVSALCEGWQKSSDPKDAALETARLWDAAFTDYEALIDLGAKVNAARDAAIKFFTRPGAPFYGTLPSSVSANWRKKIAKWQDGGRTADALADGRQGNIGTAKFYLSDDEKNALRLENLKRNSFALAIEWFHRDPACTAVTRELILAELDKAARNRRKPSWPPSLRKAGAVTDEERALFRGKKAFQTLEHCDRKGQFHINEASERVPMAANTIWESDDMSVNEPFRFSDPETGALRMGRQSLCTLDVHSSRYLAAQPIGRTRDAYRVEDIADHMARCIDAHGLPLVWRLERGVWENDFVKGIKIEGREERWGGLGALFRIQFVFKSRGKGTIETSFNLLQKFMAHESTSIGRKRGEFEPGTRLFLKAQKGDMEAAAHFWDIASAANGMATAMQAFNARGKERRAFGRDLVVPDDLYSAAQPRTMPENERWRLCPVKREATVRNGCIECVVPHYPLPFRFAVNGASADLYVASGHRVLIAFHPGRPEDGCHVFNAEEGARNREGRKFGEWIVRALMAQDAPQLNLSKEEIAMQRRKNANAAVRTEFRAISKAGTPIVKRSESRDGLGNRTETGTRRRHDDLTPAGREATNEGDALIATAIRSPRKEIDYEALADRVRELEAEDARKGLLPI